MVKAGLDGLAEHEVVELLLTLAIPRSDAKQRAKALLSRFGNLRGIVDAPPGEAMSVKGIGPVTPIAFQIIKAAAMLHIQQGSEARESMADPTHPAGCWRMRIGTLGHEVFEVAYLDSAPRLLRDGVETLEEGTVDRAAVYRRVDQAVFQACKPKRLVDLVSELPK